MSFEQACRIIYPAVTKYCYVKSEIKVDSSFLCDENGDVYYAFFVTIGRDYKTVNSNDGDCAFYELEQWIESKC